MTLFATSIDSHKHSLEVLDQLQEYDDFMESIRTLVDLGCGDGLDLEWWATRETREDVPKPLNIQCTGVDINASLPIASKYNNMVYQKTDFEGQVHTPVNFKYDVLWCHDSFQYAVDPIKTLSNWWNIASDGAMLILVVPQTTNLRRNQYFFTQETGVYYHYTLVNLIHMLAVAGWDCRSGFFQKNVDDPWIKAVVYKSGHAPMDPKTTSWQDLSEKSLLPESVEQSVYSHGELQQQDLVLPWLDQSLSWLGRQ
jgi:SAM-dependent methyltransferase